MDNWEKCIQDRAAGYSKEFIFKTKEDLDLTDAKL